MSVSYGHACVVRRQFPFGVLVTVVGVASLAARHSAQNPPPSPKRYGERPDSGDMSDKMNDNSTRSHAVAELQVPDIHRRTRQTPTSIHVLSAAVFVELTTIACPWNFRSRSKRGLKILMLAHLGAKQAASMNPKGDV